MDYFAWALLGIWAFNTAYSSYTCFLVTLLTIDTMVYSIFEGVWIDWTLGRWKGATLTLSQGNGGLLLAFIATFITLVSIRLWRIISFFLHQIHATQRAHDGIHFQRQHTLRNMTSPAAAAKIFILQFWYWRRSKRVVLRTLPWAAFALLYIAVFATLAIFSSRVSNSASTSRLILPRECGMWRVDPSLSESDQLQYTMEKTAFDVTNAVGTARTCYSANATSLSCNTTPVPNLASNANEVPCPFGDDICFDGKAYEVNTNGIDSRFHLGINGRSEDRVNYDRHLTCAPLVTTGYGQFVNDTDGTPTNVLYFYGPEQNGTAILSNYTYDYPLVRRSANISYQVNVWENREGTSSIWQPLESLSQNASDTFIIFVEPNSVLHWKPNQDPVFSANRPTSEDDPKYRPDRFVSPIACTQKHRFCTPDNTSCTPWGGRYAILNTMMESSVAFNPTQVVVASRIILSAMKTSIYEAINPRSSKCLRAQDKMDWLFQVPLPNNQWEIEVLSWAQEGLAALQAAVQEYAAGPTINVDGGMTRQMWVTDVPANYTEFDRTMNKAWESMCHDQIVHDGQGTLNFSLLGISVIFGLGILILIFSFIIEPLAATLQTCLGVGAARAAAWQRDDNLQTLRLLFESNKQGTWTGSSDLIPVTAYPNEVLCYPESNHHGNVQEVYQPLPHKAADGSA